VMRGSGLRVGRGGLWWEIRDEDDAEVRLG
jgi:hypothetical protein